MGIQIQEAQDSNQDEPKGSYKETHYNQTVRSKRQRDNLESSKRDVTHHVHGSSNKIIKSISQQKTLQVRRERNDGSQEKPSFKNKGEIKTFPDKQNLRDFITMNC